MEFKAQGVENIRKGILSRLYISSFLCLGWICLSAQENATQPDSKIERYRPKFEVTIGSQVSFMRCSDKSYQSEMNPMIGPIFQAGLSQSLSTQLDLNLQVSYSKKGYVTRAEFVDTDTNPPTNNKYVNKYTLSYINSHLMTKYFFGQRGKFGLSIGPYFGFLVSDKVHWEQYIDGTLAAFHTSHNVGGWKKFDWGSSLELSYHFNISKLKAVIKGKWERGFYDIRPVGTAAAIYNQVFAVQMGIVF